MGDRQEIKTDARSMLQRIDRIKELSTFPSILLQVNELLKDEQVSHKKVGDVIESDQVLTAKILRLVNSAFYGFRYKVIDITQALMILGCNTVRNALATVSIIDLFRMKETLVKFDLNELWKHSTAVAVVSKTIAERARLAPPGDCFVAGLLHDIGKLILAEHFNDIFVRVAKEAENGEMTFLEAERTVSPLDHAAIGGFLAQKWQFPARLVDAISFHHKLNTGVDSKWFQVSVRVADMIVNKRNGEWTTASGLSEGSPEFMEISSHLDILAEWYPACEKEIGEIAKFFSQDSV